MINSRIWLSLSILVFIIVPHSGFASTIKGRVLDAETHEPLPGAVVSLIGTKFISIVNADGSYSFKHVNIGTYSITAQSLGYLTSYPQAITIKDDGAIVLQDIYLRQSMMVMKEVIVQGKQEKQSNFSARNDERLAPNVINVISAQTIELLPDQSVADIMQRVSGVSMTKDTYGNNSRLIIRGMPTRYNSSLINGVLMPATGSSGRSVDLDLFGANLVGGIEVIKGITPDLEADAIGGTVNIKTKEAPDSAFLVVQGGTGYSQYFFNNPFLTFDNSTVASKDPSELHGPDYVAQESQFPRKNLIAKQTTAPPYLNFGVSGGNSFFKKKLGIMAAVNGQNTSEANTYVFNSYVPAYADGKPSIQFVEDQTLSRRKQRLGGYLKLDYRLSVKHRISLFCSAFETKELRVREYADHQTENGGTLVRPITTQTQTDNTALLDNMLSGHHDPLKNLEVDWTLLYALGNSHSPDFANVDLTRTGSGSSFLNYSRPVVRNWQHNNDQYRSGYINMKYKPLLLGHLFEFKTGGLYRTRVRKNYDNEYYFQPPVDYGNYPNPNLLTVPLRNNESNDNQEQKGNAHVNPGNFRAREDITAAYAMVTTNVNRLNILTGVRFESTYLYTEHNQDNIQIPVAKALQQYADLFPSLHLNYKFTNRQNLRFSFYKALNRPDFIEVIPYNNPRAGSVLGYPNLRAAYANSVDLRYEIYPQAEDVFSVGIFYKKIKNPIEDIMALNGSTTPRNVATPAVNYGLELVALKKIRNITVNANYTYTHSVISDKAIEFFYKGTLVDNLLVSYKRTLVGQSPHLFNISVSYHFVPAGLKASLTYTLQGQNLSAPDNSHLHFNRYQATYHNLGISLQQRITSKLFLSAKISNLLNSPITWFMKEENNTLIRKSYNYQTYFISLKYSFTL